MFREAVLAEKLFKFPDRMAQVPAGPGKEEKIIHIPHITDPPAAGEMVIDFPEVEGGQEGAEGTATGDTPGGGVKRSAVFNRIIVKLAQQGQMDRMGDILPELSHEDIPADTGVILPDIQPADEAKSGVAHIPYGVLQGSFTAVAGHVRAKR
ncbi:Uncharacterised protein [Escherichia coli]|nr:Uncharacterised protein [Escherichia coli]SQM27213.1 Uncharacterised protein [Escherichia coli]